RIPIPRCCASRTRSGVSSWRSIRKSRCRSDGSRRSVSDVRLQLAVAGDLGFVFLLGVDFLLLTFDDEGLLLFDVDAQRVDLGLQGRGHGLGVAVEVGRMR